MTLSDKIHSDEDNDLLWKDDVKEFIKELKEKPLCYCSKCKSFECYEPFHKKVLLIRMEKLDKLAGDKLI